MMRNVLIVALGGAFGSVLRYLVSRWVNESVAGAFPFGTMLVNVVGCLLIGVFYGAMDRYGIGKELGLLLTVGFCGGFTTFSTFMNESLSLLRVGNVLLCAAYAGGSMALGLVCVYLGRLLLCH